ncbi:hypothetical protein SLEP1_g59906 [Rubroshorea leprosula]|uniref:X8 domain-containing protein n=1 Tax=Rubroshorea leprosula TaxID=152421 RepID=A0AAV5MV23_9ROSI|nr:hypothetical protein SLEP1_g59906 [Rubroshorea leprosula]
MTNPVNGGGSVSKTTTGNKWRVATGEIGRGKLQAALDCSFGEVGPDCLATQPSGPCHDPNTLEAHASFAFNSNYKEEWARRLDLQQRLIELLISYAN